MADATTDPDVPADGESLVCAECGYDLRVCSTDQCPECGAVNALAPSQSRREIWFDRKANILLWLCPPAGWVITYVLYSIVVLEENNFFDIIAFDLRCAAITLVPGLLAGAVILFPIGLYFLAFFGPPPAGHLKTKPKHKQHQFESRKP